MDARPDPELVRLLRHILSEHGGMRLAILFGSQVTGRTTAQSDLDHAALMSLHLFDAADFLPYRNRIRAERRRAWIGE